MGTSFLHVPAGEALALARQLVFSSVEFEVSGALEPQRSGALAASAASLCGGHTRSVRATPTSTGVAFHTHPMFSMAVSCNSPSSAPSGADLLIDLVAASEGRAYCSLTFAPAGVFVVWVTRAGRSLAPSGKFLDLCAAALTRSFGRHYSLGDAVGSAANEMDLLCRERVAAISNATSAFAALAAMFGPSQERTAAEWPAMLSDATRVRAMRRYLAELASDNGHDATPAGRAAAARAFRASEKVERAAGDLADEPVLAATFTTYADIADRGRLDIPPEALEEPRRPSQGGNTVRMLDLGRAFAARDFACAFVLGCACPPSPASERLARRILMRIIERRAGYSAERIAAAVLSGGSVLAACEHPGQTDVGARMLCSSGVRAAC